MEWVGPISLPKVPETGPKLAPQGKALSQQVSDFPWEGVVRLGDSKNQSIIMI
jgi:hypothetical protein